MKQYRQYKQNSPFKRMVIFLIDGLMAFICFLILFYTAGTALLKSFSKNDVEHLNQQYIEICDQNHYPVKEEKIYGLLKVDQVEYLQILYEEEGLNNTDAYKKYQEAMNNLSTQLDKNQIYQEAAKSFNIKYNFIFLLTMMISLLIFQLLIPFLTKKRQTLAMIIFKYSIVNKKDKTLISNVKVLLRFLLIYLVEFVIIYLLLNLTGLIFIALMSLSFIAISKTNVCFHDLCLTTLVIPCESVL